MADISKLDKAYRLSPWFIKEHADHVAGRYGSLLSDPAAAEAYVAEYEKKEAEFDVAYENQRAMLRQASKAAGDKPQELPDLEKLEWNPRGYFSAQETPEELEAKKLELEAKEAAKAEKKAQKEAEKAEAKEAKKLAKAEAKKLKTEKTA